MRENDTKTLTNEGKPNFPSLMVKKAESENQIFADGR